MQTFLPYPSFELSAKSLDYRRAGKQRVEADQILTTLYVGGGWENHPAVRMWRRYEEALLVYRNTFIREWISRGYKNTMMLGEEPTLFEYPLWFGDEAFHLSHRSNLIRKDPEFYRPIFGIDVPDDLPYVWPGEKKK